MSFVVVIYIITAVVSILLGIFLFNLTKSTARAKANPFEGKNVLRNQDLSAPEDGAMANFLLTEIHEIVETGGPRQETIKKISDVFNKEIEKKVNLNTQELSKKYEALIQEEKQNEEIAWKKYNKVLTDKEKTEAVIRSVAEGLLVVDNQGKVIMMNPAAEKLLGVTKKEKIGKHVLENLKEEQLVSMVKGNEDKGEREIELVSQQDETKKILRASSAVIENENGLTVGMVSVLSDITKQKELDQLKSNFVANVSHELRTPLVAIEKSLALILSKAAGDVPPSQEEFLVIAQRNLKRLSLLVNDLLDLSKLEAGKMEFRPQPASIEKIIDDSIESLQSWADAKSIRLEKKKQGALPEVQIDPNRIIQVLNNLIGNALKFTPAQGRILIEARLSGDQKNIEVSVQDNGAIIPKESLQKIFDKFFQTSERVPTDINGTGIGLSISKELVEMHGGRIWAESQEGQGAKFIFTLPLERRNAEGDHG